MDYWDFLREEFFSNAWKRSVGIKYVERGRVPDLKKLKATQWSPEFERLMRNRLIMGGIRYGFLKAKGKHQYDRMSRAMKEIELFLQDRNKERLVDVANIMLLEFEEGEGVFESKEGGIHNIPS